MESLTVVTLALFAAIFIIVALSIRLSLKKRELERSNEQVAYFKNLAELRLKQLNKK